jgi:hypothetical protein
MAEKSSTGSRQTHGKKLVWFGEIERKLVKLPMPTFTYRSSSYLFYVYSPALTEALGLLYIFLNNLQQFTSF